MNQEQGSTASASSAKATQPGRSAARKSYRGASCNTHACALFGMLMRRADELGHDVEQLAEALGVSLGQVALMRSGVHTQTCQSGEFRTNCAAYLDVPYSRIRMACAQMSPLDAFEDRASITEMLPHAIRQIGRNDEFGTMMPRDIYQASPELQLLLVRLFEAATGRELLHGNPSPSPGQEQEDWPEPIRSMFGR